VLLQGGGVAGVLTRGANWLKTDDGRDLFIDFGEVGQVDYVVSWCELLVSSSKISSQSSFLFVPQYGIPYLSTKSHMKAVLMCKGN
jgi:hypothetical protein